MNGEQVGSKLDVLKWLVVAVLLIGGIVANDHFASQLLVFRLVGWVVLLLVAALIAFQTAKGRWFWKFLQEARTELRKVIWPNRQETMQTTLVVVVMVGITAVFLWGIDSLFLWLVGFLTGQRG